MLRKDGTCWVNIGDTYVSNPGDRSKVGGFQGKASKDRIKAESSMSLNKHKTGLPAKSLCQIPSRFAIEMTNRGWILRNEIIWYKRNCMPSSVSDRFTVDFEKVFFFCKSKDKSNDIREWLRNPLKPEEASWLAAIIDGEGTIGIRKSGNLPKNRNDTFGAYITVSNTSKEIIKKCQFITGLGKIKDAGAKTNFDMYRWELTHNQAVSIIGEIYPYLIDKREQSKVCIALQKTNIRRSYKGLQGQMRLSQKDIDEKKRLWELCKSLNQKETNSSGFPEPNLNRYSGCEDYWFEQQFDPTLTFDYSDRDRDKTKLNNTPGRTRMAGLKTNQYTQRNKRCVWKYDIGEMIDELFSEEHSDEYRRMALKHLLSENMHGAVWDITTQPFKEAHFAVFPPKLVEPMLSAGCPVDGWVLDTFGGAGTVGVVAKKQNKNCIIVELNPEYCDMADKRIEKS